MSDTGSETPLPSSLSSAEADDAPPLPAYDPAAFAPAGGSLVPPRPKVEVGSWLLMVGGGMLIVGSLMPWWTVDDVALSGIDSALGYDGAGLWLILLGLLLAGVGIAQLLVGRVESASIAGIVAAIASLVVGLIEVSQLDDLKEGLEKVGRAMTIEKGPWVVLIGSSIAFAGAVATFARRRRRPTPVGPR